MLCNDKLLDSDLGVNACSVINLPYDIFLLNLDFLISKIKTFSPISQVKRIKYVIESK